MVVWTYDQFLDEFGCKPGDASIALMNCQSGHSSIWVEPPMVFGDGTVYALAVEPVDGYPKAVAGNIRVPIRYMVII